MHHPRGGSKFRYRGDDPSIPCSGLAPTNYFGESNVQTLCHHRSSPRAYKYPRTQHPPFPEAIQAVHCTHHFKLIHNHCRHNMATAIPKVQISVQRPRRVPMTSACNMAKTSNSHSVQVREQYFVQQFPCNTNADTTCAGIAPEHFATASCCDVFFTTTSGRKSKSNSNVLSSTIKSTKRFWPWMLSNFLFTTCHWMNSSWTTSFMVGFNGPRAVEHTICQRPWSGWISYSKIASISAVASLTLAQAKAFLSIHSTFPSALTMATLRNTKSSRRRTWNQF